MRILMWASVLFCLVMATLRALAAPLADPDGRDVTAVLAAGIQRWKLADANGRWWQCGERIADPTPQARAWAETIVAAAGADLRPWWIAGVIAKESKFDECALGKRARDWGYAVGILRPSRHTISHTRADVLRVVRDRRRPTAIRAVDLGPGQIMYGSVYRGDPENLVTLNPGVGIVAQDMRRRRDTIGPYDRRVRLRPYAAWPGLYVERYGRYVRALARALGAPREGL